ncbi:hypothetical protein C2G38_1758495 [Gigaspora rosea]|uniref:Uncharacterized protein n=1 Tax=Gigaspora rosea TaxID=44941 RepID=A0A397UUV1_9GLOM|nr:hypothetical protein C2G38_1758495 [Gigaspora rosea]
MIPIKFKRRKKVQKSINDDDNENGESSSSDSNQNPSDNGADDDQSPLHNDESSNATQSDETAVRGVLNKEIRVNDNFIKIMDVFKQYKEEDDNEEDDTDELAEANIMDLTPTSPFVKFIPFEIYKEFLESSKQYDLLIPKETQKFLKDFFSKGFKTHQEWSDALDRINVDDYSEEITKLAIKIIILTLDNFLQAFSLVHMNPLINIETLEQPFLNDYIHPCIKAALWHCAGVCYTCGEIPSINHVKRQKGDGVGFTGGLDNYQIVYAEGTRPYKVKANKEIENHCKIAKNLKNLFKEIVKKRVNSRKAIIPEIEVFGLSSFKLNLHMYVLGYSADTYYIKEVDNVTIPRDFEEMGGFRYFFEAILKWAVNPNKRLF